MTDQKMSYRWLGAILFLGIFTIVLYGLSSLYSYFKTGASKEDIYHADTAYFEEAQPFIKWLKDDDNIEGSINPYIRNEIQDAYARAMRSLDLSQHLDQDVALKEHFTLPILTKIHSSLDTNHLLDFQRVHLTHNLRLHFLSLDKTVVSFTDEQSRIKKKIEGDHIDELNAYHVNMTFVDGRWRIDALEKTKPTKYLPDYKKATIQNEWAGNRGVNYYPKKTPWRAFWTEYDEEIIEADFKIIKDLNFATIRFFIPFEIFGGGNVKTEFLDKLDHFLATAEKYKVDLVPTLFDFPIGYELDKYPIYDRHLETILTRYNDAECIAYWDLKNEADLDFEHLGKEATMEWLSFIIERAKVYTSKPITLGWSDWIYADLFCSSLDIQSFHYYKEITDIEEAIISAKVNCDKPIVVSEFGMSTYSGIWPGGHSEPEQKNFITKVNEILDEQEVSGIVWCLYDYENAPKDVFGWKPWIRAGQKHFGILSTDGQKKW